MRDLINIKIKLCYCILTLCALVTSVEARQWNIIYKLPDYDNPTLVAKNQLLTTIPEMGIEWRVRFEFRATQFLQNEDTNFLWLRNSQVFAMVSMGITKTRGIGICVSLQPNSMAKNCPNLSIPVQLYQWMTLEIRQVQEAGKSKFMVFAGNAFQYTIENFPPEKVQNVKVFASPEKEAGNIGTQWWKLVTTQPGEIRRLSIAVPANEDSSGREDDSPIKIDSSWGEWTGYWSNCSATCVS